MNRKKIIYTLKKCFLKLCNILFLISDEEYYGRTRYLRVYMFHKPLDKNRKFPEGTKTIDRSHFRRKEIKHRRCAVFASYRPDGRLDDALLFYLAELNKVADTVVFAADCPLFPEEAEKLLPYADYILCERHGEYDFGSYKRGLQIAEQNGLLADADQLIFCNDSCYGPFHPFSEYFDRFPDADFSGMGITDWGYRMIPERKRIDVVETPHIETYFFVVSRKIFEADYFRQFFYQVKQERYKIEVIAYYEEGLSELLLRKGVPLQAWLPPRPKEICQYNWQTEYNWNEDMWRKSVVDGFLIKKDILASPESYAFFNEKVKKTQFPYKIQDGRFVEDAGR